MGYRIPAYSFYKLMRKWVKKFGGWVPLIIVLATTVQKTYYLNTFTSSIDDHLVAASIIYAKKPLNETSIRIAINDTAKETFHSLPKRLARKLDSAGRLMPILHKLHIVYPLYAVPNESTYAPLQFFLTAFLVRDTQTLSINLILGRLPSLLVHFFGLLLFLYLAVRYFNGLDYSWALCLALLVLSFSQEHTIYSLQMESYAIGVFGLLLLIYAYLYYLEFNLLNEKSTIVGIGLFVALCMLMQYQLLFFGLAAIVGLFFYSISNMVPVRVILKRFIVSGFVFMLFFLPVYILFLSKHTEHVGSHLIGNYSGRIQYWFPGRNVTGWKDAILYCMHFFSVNFFEVFRTMTACFPLYSAPEKAMLYINFSFFILGCYKLVVSENQHIKRVKIFIFFSLFIWLILILLGRLALTPDRHSLILLPLFALAIFLGISSAVKYISDYIPNINKGGSLFIFILLLSCLFSANNFLVKRTEPLILAGINEVNVPDNSLLITSDRLLTLFSSRKNAGVYFQTSDASRRGWISKERVIDLVPDKIYIVGSNVVSERFFRQLPEDITAKYPGLHEQFTQGKYNKISDKEFSVIDDETNPNFYTKKTTRLVVYEKVTQSR